MRLEKTGDAFHRPGRTDAETTITRNIAEVRQNIEAARNRSRADAASGDDARSSTSRHLPARPASLWNTLFNNTSAEGLFPNWRTPVAPADVPAQIDLSAPLAGQTTHQVQDGETIDTIAANYGLTREDVLLTNPSYAASDPQAGDQLTLLYDDANPDIASDRLELAHQMASPTIGQDLGEAIHMDLHLATKHSAFPADNLDALRESLIARRPGDVAFAETVRTEADKAALAWAQDGRTHEVFDPLIEAAEAGDWDAVREHVTMAYTFVSGEAPPADALFQYQRMLLEYGPDIEAYETAVRDAHQAFLFDRPHDAADEIAETLEHEGPLAAAQKLEELTDPSKTDPITAGRIFMYSEDTIAELTNYFTVGPDVRPDGTVYDMNMRDQQDLLYALNAAADSASRSGPGMTAVEKLADDLTGKPLFDYLETSVENGDGLVLPLLITRNWLNEGNAYRANNLAGAIEARIGRLQDDIRDSVDELHEMSRPLVEPVAEWGPLVGITEEKLLQWFEANDDLVDDINEKLDEINLEGYKLERVTSAWNELQRDLEGLDDYAELDSRTSPPDPEQDPDLFFAVSSSPAALSEHSRRESVAQLYGSDFRDPAYIIPDPSWPTRVLRNNLRTWHPWVPSASVGLSRFGAFTYTWGFAGHGLEFYSKATGEGVVAAFLPAPWGESGWRNVGYSYLYGKGIFLELQQAGELARTGTTSAALTSRMTQHLIHFGWWNVLGALDYFRQGDPHRGGGLLLAGTGTLISSYGKKYGARFALGWTGPVGTTMALIGSTYLVWQDYQDLRDHFRAVNGTEGAHQKFLEQNDIGSDVANQLGNNDSRGRPIGSQLVVIADRRGITPEQLLRWLNDQDSDWVHDFVENALHAVDPNENGEFPLEGIGPPVFGHPNPTPRSIDGVIEWAERRGHPLPSA